VLLYLCLHELTYDVGIWQMTCDSCRSSVECFSSCPVDDVCDPRRSSVWCTIIVPLSGCDLYRNSVGYTCFSSFACSVWQMTCDSCRSSAECISSCPVDDVCDPCRSSVWCAIIVPLSRCDSYRNSVGYTSLQSFSKIDKFVPSLC